MPNPFIQSLTEFLEIIFSHELGSNEFYFLLATAAIGFFFTGRVVSSMFGSDRGSLSTVLALGLPLILGLIAYGVSDVYALPHLREYKFLYEHLPIISIGLVVFFSVLFISSISWEIGRLVSLLTYILALSVAVAGSVLLAGVLSILNR